MSAETGSYKPCFISVPCDLNINDIINQIMMTQLLHTGHTTALPPPTSQSGHPDAMDADPLIISQTTHVAVPDALDPSRVLQSSHTDITDKVHDLSHVPSSSSFQPLTVDCSSKERRMAVFKYILQSYANASSSDMLQPKVGSW